MFQLTVEGQQAIDDLARRHGISPDAAAALLRAVVAGQGTMAQFDHPELGGSGQWMRGGMTMVGDMFNHGLKATVDSVCTELATLLGNQSPRLWEMSRGGYGQGGGSQMQSQGGAHQAAHQTSGVSLFVPNSGARGGNWWPDDLGSPASTGQQNSVRYAYFPATRRLAIDLGGQVDVYDTDDHAITGFSQQQSGDASVTFTSQHGVVSLNSLARIDADAAPRHAPEGTATAAEPAQAPAPDQGPPSEAASLIPEVQPAATGTASTPPVGDIFAMIERLADLHAKGILSDEEFSQKKTELLKRV